MFLYKNLNKELLNFKVMKDKIMIGLVGEKGSEKQTFVDLLYSFTDKNKIHHMKFSDLLSETLEMWNLSKTRENLQKLAIIMNKNFGEDTLTNATNKRIKNIKKQNNNHR